MGIRDIDKEDVSDFIWKWRCKLTPRKESLSTSSTDTTEDDDTKSSAAAAAGEKQRGGKDPGFGAEASIKTLYEGKNSSMSYFDWVDYPPKQLSKSAARAQDRVAIRVYKVKDREKACLGGRFPLKYHQIDVQNPLLVAALEPIVKKEKVHLDVNETATFKEPFRPLWFCQEEIMELHKRTDSNGPLKGYLHLLLRLMDDMFGEMRVKRKHLQSSGLIDFSLAWILFPTGSTVYSYGINSEFLCKVQGTKYIQKSEGNFLLIRTKVMVFTGEEFTWQNKTLAIASFEGNTPVRELEHYPLEHHPEPAQVQKQCIERGRKALDFQGLNYCTYSGIALRTTAEGITKHNVEGRVLIDQLGYNRYHLAKGNREDKDPKIERIHAENRARNRRLIPMPPIPPPGPEALEPPEDDDTDAIKTSRKTHLSEEQQNAIKKDMLSREEDLGFMFMLVGGYALKNKLWGESALVP